MPVKQKFPCVSAREKSFKDDEPGCIPVVKDYNGTKANRNGTTALAILK
jgi:hypothetical protein